LIIPSAQQVPANLPHPRRVDPFAVYPYSGPLQAPLEIRKHESRPTHTPSWLSWLPLAAGRRASRSPAARISPPLSAKQRPIEIQHRCRLGRERHLQQALVEPAIDPRPPCWSWCAAFSLAPPCPIRPHPSTQAYVVAAAPGPWPCLATSILESKMPAVVPCPQRAKESLSFRRRPNLPKLTFPVDRSSKLMNHPSSTSTLDSTLCYRSNHRSLPLSPCLAQLKRQSLSDFSCPFLLIKFQPPNKA
jgi:hypothetical protein